MATYSELRSNAERIADETLKERVLRGIEVLNAFDPDWAEYIDPSELLLDNVSQCVLGQVFNNHRVSDEQWSALQMSNPAVASGAADWFGGVGTPGYYKGLAILNGEVAIEPSVYGFDTEEWTDSYEALTEAWLVALGEDD